MQLNLKIPDSLYDHYLQKFGSPKHYVAMKQALESLKDVGEGERYVVLEGNARRRVEAVFETTMDTGEKLAGYCEKLNRVKIGGIDLAFNPEELQRLQMQATFHGRTLQQFMIEMIVEIKDRMLEKV